MTRRFPLLAFAVGGALVALAPAPHAKTKGALSPDAASAVVDARRAIAEAADRGSADDVLAARAQLLAVAGKDATAAPVRYTIVLADWRAVPLLLNAGKTAADVTRYVAEGLAESRALEAQRPNDGEAFAFDASFIAFQLMSPGADVMTMGPQAMGLFAKAAKLSPANPRVQLLRGIFTFFTPPQFGGGADVARPLFEKAIALSDSEAASPAADSLAPRWGHVDALLWSAQVALALHDTTAARARIDEALQTAPGSGWAHGLRASLSGAAADSAGGAGGAEGGAEKAARRAADTAVDKASPGQKGKP